ncbi:MAG: tRNA (adenosine(37)-N6)-threonylcarbamoyltransferase complex dimerization subunit type 1 TsaB [Hyphomicrobiales bacterium]
MLTLGIDTLGRQCAVALWRGDTAKGELIAKIAEPMQRGHAEALLPMVRAVMGDAGEEFSAIDRVAASRGPGSFTGLRIGLAAARGLALALDRPALGVSRLEAMAAGYFARHPQNTSSLVVAIDARRGQLYVQVFSPRLDPWNSRTLAQVIDIDNVASMLPRGPITVLGSGAELLLRSGESDAHMADIALAAGDTVDWVASIGSARDPAAHAAAPLYLRAPDAKRPASRGLRLDG